MRSPGTRLPSVLIAAVLSALPAAAAAQPPDPPEPWSAPVFRRARGSVVRVECGPRSGTGFFFHSPRHVATAFGLVATGRDVTVILPGGEPPR